MATRLLRDSRSSSTRGRGGARTSASARSPLIGTSPSQNAMANGSGNWPNRSSNIRDSVALPMVESLEQSWIDKPDRETFSKLLADWATAGPSINLAHFLLEARVYLMSSFRTAQA